MATESKVLNHRGDEVFRGNPVEINTFIEGNQDVVSRGMRVIPVHVEFNELLFSKTLGRFDKDSLLRAKEMIEDRLEDLEENEVSFESLDNNY